MSAETLVIDIEMHLRGPLAAKVAAEAVRRGTTPAVLMADVVEAVISDDLFAAVLE